MTLDVDSRPHCERDNDDEIEITPEMLEAGIEALMSWDHRFVGEEEAVSRIYSAMVKAPRPGTTVEKKTP